MTLTIDPRDFCVSEGASVDLKKLPTHVKRAHKSKQEYHYAVLVISQGMDAAGEDGAIRQVMSGVNLRFNRASVLGESAGARR